MPGGECLPRCRAETHREERGGSGKIAPCGGVRSLRASFQA